MGDKVYLRAAPPFPGGTIDRDIARAFLIYVGADPFNLGTHEGKAYLLRLSPFDSSLTLDLPGLPFPGGAIDRRKARYFTTQGRSATIYPAATGNAARSSSPTDTPANTWVPGKLNGNFNYEINLWKGADPLSGGSNTIGVLELDDPDGELDGLRTLGWDGAPLQLLRGEPDAAFSSYSVVANLSTAGILYDLRKKQIKLRDLAWQLNQAELHGLRYGGTGGEDGDATLTGIIKPYAVGQVFNITPVQINAALLCYQVSCSSVRAITAVKDGFKALTNDGDFPDYASLAAATVAGGHYATCLAKGLFRIGSAPVYLITADVQGDNDTINGLGYPSTRAQIARRIATGRGNIVVSDPDGIDATAHAALEQYQPAPLGFYFDQESTKAASLSLVMSGVAGWWCIRLNGLLAYGQLIDPAQEAPLFTLYYPDDSSPGEIRVGEPSMVDYPVRRRATLMGWSKNYTQMTTNQIATSVDQADAAIAMAVSRFTTSTDLFMPVAYPSAPVVTVDGGFVNPADAQAEGDRQQQIFKALREPFEIPVAMDPFADVVGRVLAVANSNRLGLGASRNLFCQGVAVNGNGKPTLRLWG